MKDMVRPNSIPASTYELRSSSDVLLLKPCSDKTSIASFMCEYWNNLPPALRYITDFTTFKRDLKTHLFRIAFADIID